MEFRTKIFAPDIDPRHRHPKIFEVFDSLKPGEYMGFPMIIIQSHYTIS